MSSIVFDEVSDEELLKYGIIISKDHKIDGRTREEVEEELKGAVDIRELKGPFVVLMNDKNEEEDFITVKGAKSRYPMAKTDEEAVYWTNMGCGYLRPALSDTSQIVERCIKNKRYYKIFENSFFTEYQQLISSQARFMSLNEDTLRWYKEAKKDREEKETKGE